jgi:hypothetical protein
MKKLNLTTQRDEIEKLLNEVQKKCTTRLITVDDIYKAKDAIEKRFAFIPKKYLKHAVFEFLEKEYQGNDRGIWQTNGTAVFFKFNSKCEMVVSEIDRRNCKSNKQDKSMASIQLDQFLTPESF